MANTSSASRKARRAAVNRGAGPAAARKPLAVPQGAPSCIVGVGASAGGFDPIGELLGAMPEDSGLAIVILQHLSPSQRSLSAELFARRTKMEVTEARAGERVRANCVYTIPPDVYATLEDGVLRFEVPPDPRGRRLPIDHFFHSLGEDQKERAIGVVLSGSGTDGTLGLKYIVANGGMVLVQKPENAQFDGMPRSAIATGLVAHVLAAKDMPEVMVGYARHPYAAKPGETAQAAEAELAALRMISDIMQRQRGFSFEGYRQNMLLRRIHRRMGLRRIERVADYVSVLQKDPVEVKSLFQDMLIGVTEFFRDPDAWKELEEEVIRPLVAGKAAGEPIRVWVPGSSTGEEAYSVAMVLLDERRRAHKRGPIQVFATDSNAEAVEIARTGLYPAGIAAHIPAARLARYFTEIKDDHHFQVTRELRDCVVFGVQNVVTDPPFTRVDLVSCRNLLIYLAPEVQKRLVQNFHFALKPGGYLFLGTAETVGKGEQLFKPVSRKWRIFQRLGTFTREHIEYVPPSLVERAVATARGGPLMPARPMSPSAIAQTVILERFAPASVLVNADREVLYFAGATDRYLRQPRGAPSNELLALARDGLRSPLNGALRKAATSDASVIAPGATVKRDGEFVPVKITVTPVAGAGPGEGRLLLVVFQDEPRPAARGAGKGKKAPPTLVHQLEEELRATRDDLQTTIDRLEHSNEELRVSHEEVVSGNEELQSMNEELESSKEELQSLNEELNAVNQQLQTKISEVESANNDLKNLLESSDIASICLDRELHIKWFTPAARDVLNVIATDVGRPISDLASTLAGESLIRDAGMVLERLTPVEKEIHSEDGHWYLRRTLPYRTAEDKIDGVIVNLADVSQTRRAADTALKARTEMTHTLEDRVKAATIQLRTLSGELALAEEREREAIARDLHDNLAQLLHVAKLKLAALSKARPDEEASQALNKELDTLITQAETSVRSLVFQLNPPVLSELGLVAALEWLGEEMQRSHGLAVEVTDDGLPKPLAQTSRSVVYRAVRELLINVAKHAGVDRGEVDVKKVGENMIVTVRDRGKGFDPETVFAAPPKGLGLVSVRERVSFIGGTCEVRSIPGDGTEVILTVPLRTTAEAVAKQPA